MPELTNTALVWNRACGADRVRSLPGDRALTDLLSAHGLVMNGGVLHAAECLTPDELFNAAAGFRFYGFDAAASALLAARGPFDSNVDFGAVEVRLNRQYWNAIADDSVLLGRFQEHFRLNPAEYAPLRESDRS